MVVGSDDWNAKERKGCEIWGKRHVRLESRAGRHPLSARFFRVSLPCGPWDCFTVEQQGRLVAAAPIKWSLQGRLVIEPPLQISPNCRGGSGYQPPLQCHL